MINKIKVLIVDDSILFRKVLIEKLSAYKNIEVIGYAIDAYDAQKKIPYYKPDVITLDVEMPKMNGIEFLKQLMPQNPIPVVLVSSLNLNVFEALSAGAVDFVKKPDMSQQNNMTSFISELAAKISIASHAVVGRSTNLKPTSTSAVSLAPPPLPQTPLPVVSAKLDSMIIAIGASTGGTEATLTVLKEFPVDTPGIVVVQHMPAGFTKMYAERLNRLCKMEVREAKNGDRVKRGCVLIAPGDQHMKIVKIGSTYTVSCFTAEKVSGHRPSVDVLFNSMAESVKKDAIGIIMTGMGRDGASGLLNMRKNGAYTIGQNKETCVVYGMPMVAYNIGAVSLQASCNNIAGVLNRYLSKI